MVAPRHHDGSDYRRRICLYASRFGTHIDGTKNWRLAFQFYGASNRPRGGRIDDGGRRRWLRGFARFFAAADDGDKKRGAQRHNSGPKFQEDDSFLTTSF